MHKTTVRLAALGLILALVGAACSSSKTPKASTSSSACAKPILIGAVLGKTGFMQFYDVGTYNAAKLAIQDINAAGGVLGCQLTTQDFDMKTDPPLGVQGVQQMIAAGATVLLAPGDLDTSAPALTAADTAKIPIFAEEGSDFRLGLFGPYAYAMGAASNLQGAAGAEWAYNIKNWRKAFVLVDTTIAITKSAGQAFIQRFRELSGTQVVKVNTFQNADPSIAAQITAIKNASPKPDFIYMSSFIPGSASAIKQIRAAGVNLPILCQISCGEGLDWLKGVPTLSNFYYTNQGYVYGAGDPNADIWALAQRYQALYKQPMQLSLNLDGYATIQMIAYAINKAGSTDPAAINAALQSATNVPTILGPVSFTTQYHMPYSTPVRIEKIENGKQGFVQTWTAQKVNLTGAGFPTL